MDYDDYIRAVREEVSRLLRGAGIDPLGGGESLDRLLTREEVATRFGLSRRFLEKAAMTNDGPPMIKIGRSVRYRLGDLLDYIEQRRVASTSDTTDPKAR